LDREGSSRRAKALVCAFRLAQDDVGPEAGCGPGCSLGEPPRQVRIVEERLERRSKRRRISRRNDQSANAVRDDLWQTADVRSDDGSTGDKRLQKDDRSRLGKNRGRDQCQASPLRLSDSVVRPVLEEDGPVRQLTGAVRPAFPDQDERGALRREEYAAKSTSSPFSRRRSPTKNRELLGQPTRQPRAYR
jgi:hypothetical protein